MEENNRLIELYQHNALIRGLVQMFPGISCIDTMIITRLTNLQQKRIEVFFNELESGNLMYTQELIDSNEFLHCFNIASKAAINTHRQEKIRLFARLLNQFFLQDDYDSIDEFEEALSIIDELSYREIMILLKLRKVIDETAFIESDKENEISRIMRAWTNSLPILCNDFNIEREELIAIFNRLYRTGCYLSTAGYWDHESGMGIISPLFEKIIKLAMN